MTLRCKKSLNGAVVYLDGELDEYSAPTYKKNIDNFIDENLNMKKMIFDVSGMTFMDSTGIGMLLGRYKKLKNFNIPCYLTGASVNVEKILEFSGIYNVMPKI